MEPDDIDEIERRLHLRLPRFYVEFVTSYPALPEAVVDIAEFDVLNEPGRLIATNEAVRGGGVPGLAWPGNLFIVGESGCGDYYAIGLDGESEAVRCWDHERGEFEESASSLGEFVRGLIEAG